MRIKSILSGGQTVRHSLLTAAAVLVLAIPVACAQATVTPRRVVSAPVEQLAPQPETHVMNDAAGGVLTAAIGSQGEEDWEAVIETLDPVITDPASSAYERSVALQLRGRAYYELDRIDDSIADWQAAIDTGALSDSEVLSFRVNIFQLLASEGKYDEAIDVAEHAFAGQELIELRQQKMLAQLYGMAGRFEDGMGYARAVYQAAPDDRSNQLLMLFYYQQMGMDAEASALEPLIAVGALAGTTRQNLSLPGTAPAPTPVHEPTAVRQPAVTPNLTGSIVSGRVTSAYGPRPAQPAGAPVFHGGTDIAAPTGTAISAPGAGTVTHAAMGYHGSDRWGNTIEIDHGNGWSTLYAHLDEIDVQRGGTVNAGQTIGTVGNTGVATGPHVHVEVHHDGQRVDPADYLTGLN